MMPSHSHENYVAVKDLLYQKMAAVVVNRKGLLYIRKMADFYRSFLPLIEGRSFRNRTR